MMKSTGHIGTAFSGLYEVCQNARTCEPGYYYIAALTLAGDHDNAPVPFFDGCPDTYRKGGWYTKDLPEDIS